MITTVIKIIKTISNYFDFVEAKARIRYTAYGGGGVNNVIICDYVSLKRTTRCRSMLFGMHCMKLYNHLNISNLHKLRLFNLAYSVMDY